MHANKPNFGKIKKELENSDCVKQCAKRYGTTGDITAMGICYLLRHYPELSVSEVAELVGVSISAASRSLKKLKEADIVRSRQEAQSVYYSLEDNEFTKALMDQLSPDGLEGSP